MSSPFWDILAPGTGHNPGKPPLPHLEDTRTIRGELEARIPDDAGLLFALQPDLHGARQEETAGLLAAGRQVNSNH